MLEHHRLSASTKDAMPPSDCEEPSLPVGHGAGRRQSKYRNCSAYLEPLEYVCDPDKIAAILDDNANRENGSPEKRRTRARSTTAQQP